MKRSFTPFFILGFLLILCTGTTVSAQQQRSFTSVTGKLVRVTPALADIDRNSMYGKPFVKTRDAEGKIGLSEEMMERAEEKLGEQARRASRGVKTGAIQNPNQLFPNTPGTTLGVNFNGQTSPGLSPTDNNIAVGPNHIIQTVNNANGTQFTIWNKSGVVVQPGTILSSVTGFPGFGDPVVLYDQLADRWMLAEFGPNSTPIHTLNMAISQTGNPLGAWYIYQYVDNSFFIDYPKFSVWHNAYYAYSNDFTNAGSYIGSSVYAFDRTNMLAGVPSVTMIRTRLTDPSNMFYYMGSVGLEGTTPSSQNGLFLVPSPPSTVNIFEFTPNFANPGASVVGPMIPLTVAAYSTPPAAVAQQGSGTTIQTLSYRMMFKLNYRNNGGTESIVAGHTVGNGALAAVRWYELRRVASNWTVYQQGTITGSDGNSRFMPGISMDGCGNIALMYDLSGTTSFPSIRYTGRNATDPLGQMTLAEQTIINGASAHTNARWGDYNTTVQDWPNNGSFWSTSQYGAQLTRIANFTLTGGCAPAPNVVLASANITSESCAPANGVIDPGETVTVSFCLQNTGAVATTNVVGTLNATGGVVTPSGPQNYGAIAPGATVCRNFTFTNASLCGQTVVATLAVADGATPYGPFSTNYQLGALVTTNIENFDAVVAPALPAGWTATNVSGSAPLWVTSNAGTPAPPVVSAPNAAFVDNPSAIADKQLTSALFTPGAGAKLTFQNNYDLESTFDGGVLEISINGGAYQDIVAAGGSFATGGYTGTISSSFGNPLGGRQAWTGTSGSFQLVTVNLPPAAAGQPCRLKFRMGSDNSFGNTGWRIDDISLVQSVCCSTGAVCTITCPANITTNSAAGVCGANVTFPAAVTTGPCGAVTYSPANGSFFPVGTTTVTATTAAGASCSFTVTVVDNVPPVVNCPANISRNTDPGVCGATVTFTNPVAVDNCDPGTPNNLSQSTNNNLIVGGTGIACNAGDNHFWRAYTLSQANPVRLKGVRFGVEVNGTSQDATVRVYSSAGAFPGATRTLLASQTVTVNTASGVFYTVNFATPPTVPGNSVIAVEVETLTGGFYPGANALGETAPSYISSASCGVATPVTMASLGFTANHFIIDLLTLNSTPIVTAQIAGLPSGSVFPVGVTTNTFRAVDAVGNVGTCSFTVTVTDNQAPTLTCPASIVRNTDAGVCYATVAVPNPVNTDNCAVVSLTYTITGATTATSPATGINYVGTRQFNLNGTTGQGVSTVTYTAKDAAGNTSICSFTVTVNDAVLPVISVQPATKFFCAGSAGVFSVTATSNNGPLAYQWQEWNGAAWANISGATTNSYSVPNVSFADNTRSFRVVLTGLCSQVISQFATLYVNPLPTVSLVTSVPPSLIPGQTLTITVNASPAGGTYAWFKNGQLTSHTGATWTGLTVDDIGTYKVTYTDPNGCSSTTTDVVISGQASDNLWVYPNPNNGQFQIRFFNTPNETATVQVFDSKGAKVYEKANLTSTPYTGMAVDLGPTISSGTYVVTVVNSAGKQVAAKKMVVRKKP
ncbi:MAG: HYR domain-containing protein [Chitinophagaceae bacterium]|nr:HYR domain-containing protein [Chitinophagaceae bacterium]